ncbi:hypothetical protein HTVC100P_gp19 [Pelagibacter phage HTVC100P]|nr:hypothetical protein HTVC100P_gp19 [Pelagibacter phage HTVC100P]
MLKKGFDMTDNIKEPAHYVANKIEPIDFIIENNFNFCEGNVIKYISRYKRKNGIEDLKKARQYIDFLIKKEVEKTK